MPTMILEVPVELVERAAAAAGRSKEAEAVQRMDAGFRQDDDQDAGAGQYSLPQPLEGTPVATTLRPASSLRIVGPFADDEPPHVSSDYWPPPPAGWKVTTFTPADGGRARCQPGRGDEEETPE